MADTPRADAIATSSSLFTDREPFSILEIAETSSPIAALRSGCVSPDRSRVALICSPNNRLTSFAASTNSVGQSNSSTFENRNLRLPSSNRSVSSLREFAIDP